MYAGEKVYCPRCGASVRVVGQQPRLRKHEYSDARVVCSGSGADARPLIEARRERARRHAIRTAPGRIDVAVKRLREHVAAVEREAERSIATARDALARAEAEHAAAVAARDALEAEETREADAVEAVRLAKIEVDRAARPDGCICDYPAGEDGARRHRFGCLTQGRGVVGVEVA